MKTIHIFRGAPGSGKSTAARKVTPHVFEADQFFMRNGKYKFDMSRIKDAHAYCKKSVEDAMRSELTPIAVANTFTKKWEYQPYLDLAKQYGYKVEVHHCTGNYKNIHGVPDAIVARMKSQFEK
jgi:predicted kinase